MLICRKSDTSCMQYALDRPGVLTVLPGVRNREDLKRILGFLTAAEAEKDLVRAVRLKFPAP